MEPNAAELSSEGMPITVTVKPSSSAAEESVAPQEDMEPVSTDEVVSSPAEVIEPSTQPTVGGSSEPESPTSSTPSTDGGAPVMPVKSGSGGRSKKPLLLGLIIALLLGGSAAAYYFGYYNNPTVVYNQSLTNTGKAYDTLTTYFDSQSKLNYKGYTGSGSYTIGSGGFATDGKLTFNSDGDNSDATADINLGASRLGLDFRAIKSKTTTPDLYFKASGLSGLTSLVGATYGGIIGKYDNQWIMVDPSLLTGLQQKGGTSSASSTPTHDQVLDAAQAFGRVNRQYVFTTDKSKSVTTVVKDLGSETVDGHKTFHYQIAFVKDNVKAYLTAQRDALKASKLGTWIKQNNYDNMVDLAYDSLTQSADGIKATDTVEVWMDSSQRVLYKIRVADPKQASNYTDFGVDYKGGTDYPFFVKFSSVDKGTTTTGSFVLTLNTDDTSTKLALNAKGSGKSGFTFKADLVLKPTNNAPAISAPTGSKPLTQVMHELGLDGYLNQLKALGATSATPTTTTPLKSLN